MIITSERAVRLAGDRMRQDFTVETAKTFARALRWYCKDHGIEL